MRDISLPVLTGRAKPREGVLALRAVPADGRLDPEICTALRQHIEALKAMEITPCAFRHHLRWQHGGSEQPLCEPAVRRLSVFCGHSAQEIFREAVAFCEAVGLIGADAAACFDVSKESSALSGADADTALLASLADANRTANPIRTALAPSAAGPMSRFKLDCAPFEVLPSVVESVARSRQEKAGAALLVVRTLLISVLECGIEWKDDGRVREAKICELLDSGLVLIARARELSLGDGDSGRT